LPFQLHFEELQRAFGTATCYQLAIFRENLPDRHGPLRWSRSPDVEVLPAKTRVRTRPGLESAEAVQYFLRAHFEVDLAVCLVQDVRQSCSRMILRARMNRARTQS